jgi:hypothetical protein
MNQPIDMNPEELFTVIGELEVVRRKLLMQINEMSREITRLREENGKLGEPNNPK